MKTTTRKRAWALGMFLPLALAACGSDDAKTAATTPTTVAPTTASTTAATTAGTTAATTAGSTAATTAVTTAATTAGTATGDGSPGSLSSLLPDDIRSAGVIKVGTSTVYPPYDFLKEGSDTVVGFDIDLGTEVAKLLGVKFEYQTAGFDELIPGLQAKRFDIGWAGHTDTMDREKVVDFVVYGQSGIVILTQSDKAATTKDLTSICGKSLAFAQGTYGQQTFDAVADLCKTGKLAAPTAVSLQDGAAALLAVKSGRVDYLLEDTASGGYDAQQSGGTISAIPLENATGFFASANSGIVFPKGSTQLTKAFQTAINTLIANGKYAAILDKWGVSSFAVPAALINSPSY
ncbi:MAG TPA: ABC transporter substrate-binding protein [Ilumatobacteraceae bacterium]